MKVFTIKTKTLIIALLLLALPIIALPGVSVEAAVDPVLAACNKAVGTSLQKKACTADNIKKAKNAATTICKNEMGAAQDPPAPECINKNASQYVKDAAKAKPKNADTFTKQLASVTQKAVKDSNNKAAEAEAEAAEKEEAKKPTDPKCSGEGGCDLVAKYVNPAINLVSGLIGLFAVVSLIIGGIQYSMSSGDPQAVAKAKDRIRNTIMLLVIFFFFYAFVQFLVPGGIF